jgi:hypothetical protein
VIRRRTAALLGLLLVVAGAPPSAGGQVIRPPARQVRQDTLTQAQRDSLARADSLRQDSLPPRRVLEFQPPDSVMNALLERQGYSVTRYQGDTIQFNAGQHLLILRGKPSMVSRDSAILVGQQIRYNDSTQIIVARGDTLVLRDPSRGSDDVVGLDSLRYNVRTREGYVREVTTAVESGERWIVHGGAAAFRGDTTEAGRSAFYARDGWLTSCQETRPHYHFASSDMKLISKNILVARPAILYIADIPVAWIPFIVQDIRPGRRSGIIAPRFGFSELVRNNPSYRRTIEDFGYYFALNDYVDARLTMDWRSDARPVEGDRGWVRFNAQSQYRVRDLFLTGTVGASYHYLRDGSTNQQYSWSHQQEFSQRTNLNASLNYVTNTTVQRNTAFNPFIAMQTISSQLNFNTARGPFKLSLGGTQKQYPGRDQLDRDFPALNISSTPIQVGEWLTWTPSLAISNSQSFDIDARGDFAFRYIPKPGGGVDSVAFERNTRASSIRFDTPLEIYGFSWRNSFNITDRLDDFPQFRTIVNVNDTSQKSLRVYKRTFVTSLDWSTSFSLPSLSQGRWNLQPSVQIQKVDGGFGLLVRTERTGGEFVAQSLRPAFGVSVSPTLHRILPGFGPLTAIRHTINPGVSFQYTPAGDVSDEFLEAVNRTRVGYLGANRQRTVSLSLNTTFEGKLRPPDDSTPPEQAPKIKLLQLNFTPLTWDFERASVTGNTGLVNNNFGITMRSDLIPGLDLGADWSLFQGDPISDTATFKPFRESLRASISLGAGSPLIRGIGRLLGFDAGGEPVTAAPEQPAPGTSVVGAAPPFVAGQPITGGINQLSTLRAPRGAGWNWSLTYSARRSRPPRGSNVSIIDPEANCEQFRPDPFLFQTCVQQEIATSDPNGPGIGTTLGGTYFVSPPQSNAQSSLTFHITEHWGALWSTTYDFETARFASHIFTLTREMHDWDTVFAFSRASNGNFAFNLHISLKAQPEIKLDIPRRDSGRITTPTPPP